jgi:hypothetical protein
VQPFFKQKNNTTNSECVSVALGIQRAMRMRHIVSVACPATPNFSTLSKKRRGFRKKNVIKYKVRVFILPTLVWEKLSEQERSQV